MRKQNKKHINILAFTLLRSINSFLNFICQLLPNWTSLQCYSTQPRCFCKQKSAVPTVEKRAAKKTASLQNQRFSFKTTIIITVNFLTT